MPAKKSQTTRAGWEVDFVRCELDKTTREQLKKWDVKGELTYDAIDRLVSDGYKLTISRDGGNDTVGAWLTSPKRTDGGRQQCLGARGPNFFGAMRALIFKHSIILDGDWAIKAQNEDGDAVWG